MVTGIQHRNNGAEWPADPVVRVADERGHIRVTAQMPGVRDEEVRIDIEQSILIISASGDGRHYRKKICLPVPVRFAQKRFSNGELEILLEKVCGI